MDLQLISSWISSVGFPILACIYMWKYISTSLKDFTETIHENTRMIEKLIDKLDEKDVT